MHEHRGLSEITLGFFSEYGNFCKTFSPPLYFSLYYTCVLINSEKIRHLMWSVLSQPYLINSTIVYTAKVSSCLNRSVGISWMVA